MAQPSAWSHCCWCRIGLMCERLPPAADALLLNAQVNALDGRMRAWVDRSQGWGGRIDEMEAQLAVLEDQMTIANTVLREQIVAHQRREGEGPRIQAPPPELLVRSNDGPR